MIMPPIPTLSPPSCLYVYASPAIPPSKLTSIVALRLDCISVSLSRLSPPVRGSLGSAICLGIWPPGCQSRSHHLEYCCEEHGSLGRGVDGVWVAAVGDRCLGLVFEWCILRQKDAGRGGSPQGYCAGKGLEATRSRRYLVLGTAPMRTIRVAGSCCVCCCGEEIGCSGSHRWHRYRLLYVLGQSPGCSLRFSVFGVCVLVSFRARQGGLKGIGGEHGGGRFIAVFVLGITDFR